MSEGGKPDEDSPEPRAVDQIIASPAHSRVDRLLGEMQVKREFPKSINETRDAFVGLTRLVQTLVGEQRPVRDALVAMEKWATQPLTPKHTGLVRQIASPSTGALQTLVAVTHWRALWVLRTSMFSGPELIEDTSKLLEDPAGAVQRLAEQLDEGGAELLGQLIVEAQHQAATRSGFAQNFHAAADSFRKMQPQGDREDPFGLKPDLTDRSRLGPDFRSRWWHLPAHLGIAISLWE